ncbi:MAG: glycosyltransferase family 39 protein [Candidatus Atelocyanobacterium thalassa]
MFENKIIDAWKKDKKTLWLFSFLWLFLISSIAFFSELGNIGLLDKTEPMFAEAARQMVVTGDWITPYWNQEVRFDKPPLTYWLIGLSYKIFGINEWGARIPSALAAILVIILAFYTLKNFGDTTSSKGLSSTTKPWLSAWIGSGIIALNPFWIAWGRTSVSDIFLASSISLALFSFFLGYVQQGKGSCTYLGLSVKKLWYLGYWIFMSLGILAKGPVALVLPGIIVSVFLIYVKQLVPVIKEISWISGLLSFSLISTPWFILVTMAHGQEYINTFFGLHNVQRFTSVVSRHPGAWYYYAIVIIIGLLPWSVYFPLALAELKFWKRDQLVNSSRSNHLGIFCLCWFIVIFLFFSISATKLISYILPSIPALAVILTLFWGKRINNNKQSSKIWPFLFLISCIANIGILIGFATAIFYSHHFIGNDPVMPELENFLLRSHLLVKGGIIWSFSAFFALLLVWIRNYRSWLWVANLLGFLGFFSWICLPVAQLVDSQRHLPLREIANLIKTEREANERLVFLGFMRPSLVFYTQGVVDSITESDIDNGFAIKYFQQINSQENILIVSEKKYLDKLHLAKSDYTLMQQESVYKLIRIKKKIIANKLKQTL